MLVATCRIQLSLNGVTSLKDKRRIVQSIVQRIRNQFHITIAEIEHQDVWQTAVLGMAMVGNDRSFLHGGLEKVDSWLELNRPDCYIVEYQIEFR